MLDDSKRQLIVSVTESATDSEKEALASWARQLLVIRASELSASQKARQAVNLTLGAKVIWPIVKNSYHEIKRLGWEDRGWPARLGLAGAAVGLAVFGGQGAGIAALGTAVGVPLWIVLGSGAAFAGVLVEELSRDKKS